MQMKTCNMSKWIITATGIT